MRARRLFLLKYLWSTEVLEKNDFQKKLQVGMLKLMECVLFKKFKFNEITRNVILLGFSKSVWLLSVIRTTDVRSKVAIVTRLIRFGACAAQTIPHWILPVFSRNCILSICFNPSLKCIWSTQLYTTETTF